MTEEYKNESYWKLVEEFVAELKTANYWCKPDGKLNPEWKLFEADTLAAARDAAWDAAGAAARADARADAWDAAGAAAWVAARDAARDAARVAARDAAGDAARVAAWVAAWDAAGDATRDAAWDAAIFGRMLVCVGLKIELKHLLHLNARMEVWRKGYCLLCDVNGVLYVYAKKKEVA